MAEKTAAVPAKAASSSQLRAAPPHDGVENTQSSIDIRLELEEQLSNISEVQRLEELGASFMLPQESSVDSQVSAEKETTEWLKVPPVLRETIKNILLSLRQHNELLEKTRTSDEMFAAMKVRIQELEAQIRAQDQYKASTTTKSVPDNPKRNLSSEIAISKEENAEKETDIEVKKANDEQSQMPFKDILNNGKTHKISQGSKLLNSEGETALWRSKVMQEIQKKAEKSTLEKVVKHLATRDEVKRYIECKLKGRNTGSHSFSDHDRPSDNVHNCTLLRIGDCETKLESLRSQVNSMLLDGTQLRGELELLRGRALGNPTSNDFASDESVPGRSRAEQNVMRRVMHAIDEKMYLISAEVSSLQARIAGTSAEGSRRGVWLWKTGNLKHASAISWTYEAQNSDQTNYLWEPEDCVIKIVEPGVYSLGFAFFTRIKPSIQLVVNGESVLSAIHSPTYSIHHGSGLIACGSGRLKPGSVTGLSLYEYICVPARSAICLHWHGKIESAVEGFLELRRVI